MHAAALALVATAMTLVVGLASSTGWAGYVVGGVLALTLWVILFCGTLYGAKGRPLAERVPVRAYAVAAGLALVLGGGAFWLTGTTVFWAVGVIVAGVLFPVANRAQRDAPSA